MNRRLFVRLPSRRRVHAESIGVVDSAPRISRSDRRLSARSRRYRVCRRPRGPDGAGLRATPNPAARDTSVATHWDDSWSARLTAKHRAVFDMAEVDDGAAIYHAVLWLEGCRAALGAAPGDAHAVIVIRHAAVVLAFNDAMWSKYELGKERKVKDDATGKWAVRNPYASPTTRAADDPPAQASGPDTPRGQPRLVCATRSHAARLRPRHARHVVYPRQEGQRSSSARSTKSSRPT